MKVLWFSNTPALGIDYLNNNNFLKGSGGWLHSLNRELQDNIFLSVVFHYPYNISNFKYLNTAFYPVYTGNIILENIRKRVFKKVYDSDFLDLYLKIINEINPDIIHIHGTENSFLSLLGRTEVPVVISIQGNLNIIHHKFITGFFGKYMNYKAEKISLKSILFGRSSFFKEFQTMKAMAEIEAIHLRSAVNIIGRTHWDNRISRILAPDSTYYRAEELLRDSFYQTSWNNFYKEGRLVIFTTNGDTYYKGFETICFALKLLLDLNIDIEWRVAGIHNHSLINRITKKFLKQNYPKTRLKLLGSLNEKEIVDNLLESHIYVMPSHIENSPNNLCEAMIIGMPCIATFAGGTGSILSDAEEGILIQDGDPWAMAGAIMELKSDSEKSRSYSKKAKLRALKRHNKERVVEQYVQIYKEVIKNHNK